MRLTNVRAVARIASHYMIAYDEIINNNTFLLSNLSTYKWPKYCIYLMEFANIVSFDTFFIHRKYNFYTVYCSFTIFAQFNFLNKS